MTSLLSPTRIPQKHLLRPGSSHASPRSFASHIQLLTFLAITASILFSLAYVWFFCPFDLASDEAHYWDWSRHLDWCYYSKGPLVAWLIRGSCELFGPISTAVNGDLGAAVRLPAILCHGALLLGSYFLASGLFRSPLVGLIVVAVEASLPLVRVGSVLMTIDAPFLACWCWALYCVWKALESGKARPTRASSLKWWVPCPRLCVGMGTVELMETCPRKAVGMAPIRNQPFWNGRSTNKSIGWWIAAAVFTALGILAKFTMALLPAGVMSYFLIHKRSEFSRPGIWIFLAGAILGWIPIVEWNSRHQWVSFQHVFGQIGGDPGIGAQFHWFGPVAFLGGQFGMLFGGWLVAFLIAGWRFRPHREQNAGMKLIWWCTFPVWYLFALVSFIKAGQPNWPAPAYVGGTILAVAWLCEQLTGSYSRIVRMTLMATVTLSLALAIAIHFPGTVRPTLAHLLNQPTIEKPLPIRNLDISARLVGWRTLADEVDRLRMNILNTTGEEPILAGTNWTIPGHLGFYCQGHPQAYALGTVNGTDRHSQYDFWGPNPVKDAQAFRGRTFVIVGDIGPELRQGFEWIEPGREVVHSEDGIPIAAWTIWVCHGFRGFVEFRADGRVPGY